MVECLSCRFVGEVALFHPPHILIPRCPHCGSPRLKYDDYVRPGSD